MVNRLWHLFLLGLSVNVYAVALPTALQKQLEQACGAYLQTTQRAPEKLITCLRYFQKDTLPSRNGILIGIIGELYAADLMLLNELSHIFQKSAGIRAPIIQLFPNNLTAAGKKLYREAELLITGALTKI